MSELNVDLLERIADHIESHAEQFDMDRFEYEGECGTVCCIAGWASLLGMNRSYEKWLREDAEIPDGKIAEFMGLPIDNSTFGSRMFFTPSWPPAYRQAHNNETDHLGKAMVAAELLRDVAKNGYSAVFDADYSTGTLPQEAVFTPEEES